MTTRSIDSFVGLFRKPPAAPIEIELQEFPQGWNKLPAELQDDILTRVAHPARMALVSRDVRKNSDYSYTVILREYQTHPPLIAILSPSDDHLGPAKKVQKVYIIVVREAKNCRVDLSAIKDEQPLAPIPLRQIRERTLVIINDKVLFYRAIFNALHPPLAEPFNQMTNYEIIEYSERRIMTHPNLFARLRGDLNLDHLQLTHLPSQIQYLKNITRINLSENKLTDLPPEMTSLSRLLYLSLGGNPLTPESVLAVCKAIPGPQTVVIDSEQPALVQMFAKEVFRHLRVIVTEVIREEDIIV